MEAKKIITQKRTIYSLAVAVVVIASVAILLGLLIAIHVAKPPATTPAAPTDTPATNPSAYGHYRHAAVSSDTKACSPIGVDILARLGGSAVDAAIGTMLCVGVVNAHSCGIGGGHFMTIYDTPRNGSKKEFTTITAREAAPRASHRDMYNNDTLTAQIGGRSIGVPGEVLGMYEAWKRFGRLPWADLFQPTIDLCQNGFIVERALASALKENEMDVRSDPGLSATFVKPDGQLYKQGDVLRRPKLALTLRRIAEDPLSFYNGSLADDIIADIQERDGILEKDDLLNYTVKVKPPLTVKLTNGNYTVYSPRPPSSGAIYEYILNILDGYNFTAADVSDQSRRALTYHRIAEAFKFAYARRSALGDEDFVNVTELVANLTSEEYAEWTRQRITDTSTQPMAYYGPSFEIVETHGTAHLSVLAADGSAVAFTSTINLNFGSLVIGSRTDIIYNDEMDDFSIPGTSNAYGVRASPSNYVEPGKRPLSSMCPSIILNSHGDVVLINGASGGTRITTATAFVAVHNLWFGLPLNEAVDTPRLHHQLAPNYLRHEARFDQTLLEALKAKGHTLRKAGDSMAIVGPVGRACPQASATSRPMQGVAQCPIVAVSDTRKGGVPDGY